MDEEDVEMKKDFKLFSFRPEIDNVIRKLHFNEPTEIQHKVIPAVLDGKSVVGQSQTGSGKTHAFLLPLINQLKDDKREVQIVITLPTRELATQMYNEVKKVIQFAEANNKWKAKLLVGGTDKQKMAEGLKTAPHIIVGTPGRILDLVNDGVISIYTATSFVIDEADLMLDLGFIMDVDKLLVRCQSNIQILAFSATIPNRLKHFFKKYLKQPEYIKIDDRLLPEKLEHRLIAKNHRDPTKIIMELTTIFNPYLAIIFTNNREEANELAKSLQTKGLDVGLVHGGLTPRERKRVLKQIEDLHFQYIVATDLASRGIDIKGVSHVINASLPKEMDFYIHRVGRTARANMQGLAISLYDEEDSELIEALEKRGVSFLYSEPKNGEWKEVKPWDTRKRRKNARTDIDEKAWNQVRRPKKVKPGYKKKMKREKETIKRRMLERKNRKR